MTPDIARYEKNLREELDGSALYAALAAAEVDPTRKDLFLQLSQAEAGHAQLWREKLTAAGVDAQRFTPSLRTRVLARLAQRFGPRFVLPAIAATEFADRDKYAGQPDASALSSEERGHATVIQAAATSRTGGMIGADIAKAEPWHRRASGNDLRAAVLGANDGLVSNLCLVMGVAGAGQAPRTILLTGLAGLVAGAVSMALGEWLSVTNAQEFARSQIDQEKDELEQAPDSERKELALIRRVGRQPVECRRILVRLVRAGGVLSGLSVFLRRRHDRNRVELGAQCRRLGGDRPRHFAFQRPRACVLGDTTGPGRSGRCSRHLCHGGADRRVTFLSVGAPVVASSISRGALKRER